MTTDHDIHEETDDPQLPIHLDTDIHRDLLERIGKAIATVGEMVAALEPGGSTFTAKNMEEVREIMGCEHKFYPAEALDSIADLHVRPILEQLYATCPELVGKPEAIKITWRAKHATSKGDVCKGTLGLVPAKERAMAALEGRTVYTWELTLPLDVWLVLTPEERMGLCHHECMHADIRKAKPALRNHDSEEFGATAARFGLPAHKIRYLALAMANREVAQAVRTWVAGPDDAPLLGSWQTVN